MTALATLLAGTSDIGWVIELTYRDPDTDTVTTKRVTTPNVRRDASKAGYLYGLVVDPGDRDDQLDADELGGIASALAGPIVLANRRPAPGAAGPLDFLRSLSLAGRSLLRFAGAPTEAISNYEEVGSGVMDGEPEFDDDAEVVRIRLQDPLRRLSRDLDIHQYLGEPTALQCKVSGNRATTSHTAAHDLAEFTIGLRFRVDVYGSTTYILMRKGAVAANMNFYIYATGTSHPAPQVIEAGFSSGGVAEAMLLRSAAIVADRWYRVVVSRRTGYAYLMVDGKIVAEDTSHGDPDQPAEGLRLNNGQATRGAAYDWRLYGRYFPPDEARSVFSVRAETADSALVSNWRGNDATGNALTDDAGSSNATITGVENTDFAWVATGDGLPEMSGESMPAVLGYVAGAPADLVNADLEVWRYSDRVLWGDPSKWVTGHAPTVYDQGDALAITTDYTLAEPLIHLVAAAGEPLTTGWAAPADADQAETRIEVVLGEEILGRRLGLASGDYSTRRLQSALPGIVGTFTRRVGGRELLAEFLSGLLGYATLDLDGTLRLDALTPPIAPSPRDDGAVAISSSVDSLSHVVWSRGANILTGRDFTLAAWVKVRRYAQGTAGPLSTDPDYRYWPVLTLADVNPATGSIGSGAQLALDPYRAGAASNFRLRDLSLAPDSSVSAPWALADEQDGWWFVAVAHDNTGGTCKFYAAPEGGTLALLATTANLGYFVLPGSSWIGIGAAAGKDDLRGSVHEPQVWTGARNLTQLQTVMDTRPVGNEGNLKFFARMNGTDAEAIKDRVSSTAGTLTGDVVAVPHLTVDLRVTPRPYSQRRLRPARRITTEYAINHAKLNPEALAVGASAAERAFHLTPNLEVPWLSQDTADDYLDARDLTIRSPARFRSMGEGVSRLARRRYATGRVIASLGDVGREAMILPLGGEVRVYGAHSDLTGGPAFVATRVRRQLAQLTADLELWR